MLGVILEVKGNRCSEGKQLESRETTGVKGNNCCQEEQGCWPGDNFGTLVKCMFSALGCCGFVYAESYETSDRFEYWLEGFKLGLWMVSSDMGAQSLVCKHLIKLKNSSNCLFYGRMGFTYKNRLEIVNPYWSSILFFYGAAFGLFQSIWPYFCTFCDVLALFPFIC